MGTSLMTRWGKAVDPDHVLEEYPRPGMRRDSYICLNGYWDYAITGSPKIPDEYEGRILVPFSPEALLSGVNRMLLPDKFLHYRRTFSSDKTGSGKRLILHFGAVDQNCEVYVNGCRVGEHSGGYWKFSFDITAYVREGENLLQVIVWDLSDTEHHSRGKQSMERGGMWYTPQSGIWQSVWMEYVPDRYIAELKLTPDLDGECIRVQVMLNEPERRPLKLTVLLKDEVILEADGITGDICNIPLPSCKPWSPEDPVLYDLIIRTEEDEVASYFAMRKISLEKDPKGILRMFLNNRPYYHNGLLDQGYYPDGLYTAPSDEAMVNDILQMKAFGFNMLRKHVKIEPDRWYYHCDRLGMLVWQDMINGGERYKGNIETKLTDLSQKLGGTSRDANLRRFLRKNEDGRKEFAREVEQTIRQLYNFPSIVLWVPFNEGWGQFETGMITKLVMKTDPSRLVDEASGWFDQGGGDVFSIHNYFVPLMVRPQSNRCVAVTEFGGYSWHIADHSWTAGEFGYRKYDSREKLTEAIVMLWQRDILPNIKNGLSASVYTEVSDVEDETNGLLTYDREVIKVDAEKILQINRQLAEVFDAESGNGDMTKVP